MKPPRKSKKLPNTRLGWHHYYSNRFDKNQDPQTAHLAMWYWLLQLAFD